MQTRWHHLSDKELYSYESQIEVVSQDTSFIEELFQRLGRKMDDEYARRGNT